MSCWIKLDAAMLDHPKWVRALRLGGDAALHLWLQITMWSARHLTDGVIPSDVASAIPGPRGVMTMRKAWQALAEASLIERQSNGDWLIHDYLDHQRSRTEVMAGLERKAQHQRNQRATRRVDVHAERVKPKRADVDLDQNRSREEKRERDPDPDARAPESSTSENPPEPATSSEPRNQPPIVQPLPTVPGLLGPSQRERERDSGPGTVPALRYAFREEWDPNHEHRARGLELGLTDEQILERAEHCRRKAYPAGIRSEDDQFFRELMWLRNDLEKTRFKESASARRRFENPGSDRTA